MPYPRRSVSSDLERACDAARTALLEKYIGDVSASTRAVDAPGSAPSSDAVEVFETPAGEPLGIDGIAVFSRGLADPSLDAGDERCGLGYELFVLVPKPQRAWAIAAVRYLCRWEIDARIDLARRVAEEDCVTIERIPLASGGSPASSLLCFAPWEAETTPCGSLALIVASRIHDDELEWALRYKATNLAALLEKSRRDLISDPERPSCLVDPALASALAEAQMRGWYERLEDSGVAGYFLDEVIQRLGDDWSSLCLRVLRNGNASLSIESTPPIHVDWTLGSAPPVLLRIPLREFPAAVTALANLMGIVAAPPGSLVAGEWDHVEMRIARAADQFKLDWDFGYPRG